MPELPEVETIKNQLVEEILNDRIIDVIFLWDGILKGILVQDFKKKVLGRRIIDIKRRAKNLLIFLDSKDTIVVHFKLTGHALLLENKFQVNSYGSWEGENLPPVLKDPQNQFIRVIFKLASGRILAISDLRKFAYLKLFNEKELDDFLREYGPEPFDENLTFEEFKKRIQNKKSPIKKVLMDQKVIAGIGNIYSDEALFEAKIHPLVLPSDISEEKILMLFKAIKKVLKEALGRGGTSISDFRNIKGERGTFDLVRKVYRREGKPCLVCGALIQRIKIGGRSAYFCPVCQKK